MVSEFKGAIGRARVSVVQKFVKDEGGILAISFPTWGHAIEVYAHSSDGSMEVGEANAELIAEAFNTLHETGLTPRQLAESRAELLEALSDVLDGLGVLGGGAHELCGHGIAEDRAEEIKRIYLSNATGGEG